MAGPVCEVCRKAPPKTDDVLCEGCNNYYMTLLELLAQDPRSLDKLNEVFEWRMRKVRDEMPAV